ncbi:hypothetical protein [Brevibacillus centrosporus]|uniref:hypothetical protein n=1 Tax=Brevibacillus centrosporus TaxID=54910 RepID=UPI001FE2469C|nr:hypothetical protein [Brevibacillus centrosporus]MEC2131312.1 hypothetical protein [Brevibacillus centrosporus]
MKWKSFEGAREMSVNITNFAVVQLPVKDVEVSVKWYNEVLGIPIYGAVGHRKRMRRRIGRKDE